MEVANGGTLFLDEVGDMSLKTQAKVLRALDEQRFYPVGASRPVHVDARVIAAIDHARSEDRRMALGQVAAGLSRTFYDFEPDFFQQNVSRIVDDEVGLIRASLEIWPTLLEIVYFKRHTRSLPMRRVRNKQRAMRSTLAKVTA